MKKSTKIAVSAPEPQSHVGADGLMTDKAAQTKIAALRAKDQKYHKASKRLTVVAASHRIAPPLSRFAVKKTIARAVKANAAKSDVAAIAKYAVRPPAPRVLTSVVLGTPEEVAKVYAPVTQPAIGKAAKPVKRAVAAPQPPTARPAAPDDVPAGRGGKKAAKEPAACKFKADDRVRVLPFAETNQPEQFGTVEGIDKNGTICIRVDKKYRGKKDDGLRDVTADQLEHAQMDLPLDAPAERTDRFTWQPGDVTIIEPEPIKVGAGGKLHDAIMADGFRYVASAGIAGNATAYGYDHKDGRAALITVAADGKQSWTLRTHIGGETGGKDTLSLAGALMARPSRSDLAVVPRPPAGPPPNVVRAVEMLGGVTLQRYDLDTLKGDKNYGRRVALLKKLLTTNRVLVADSGLRALESAFYSAVGAEGKNTAERARDFAARCKVLAAKSRTEKTRATKTAKAVVKAARRDSLLDRIVAGTILPPPEKPKSKAQRADELEDVREELAYALSVSDAQHPVPKADVDITIVPGDVGLLQDPSNGIVMMQMERENSQGAVVTYNNGSRVAAGVVPLATLKTLRPVPGVQDLIEFAHQLLHPLTAGVPVTPTAARLLTAVTNCKELSIVAEKTAKSKKFEAPAKAATKKSAGKPAVAKKPKGEAAPRKASTYRLLNAAKKVWSAFGGQKKTIVDALVKAGAVGAKATGLTAAALTDATGIASKNVAFYMSVWQNEAKTGAVVVEKVAPAA